MREILQEYLQFIVAVIAFLLLLGLINVVIPYFGEISKSFVYALTGVTSS